MQLTHGVFTRKASAALLVIALLALPLALWLELRGLADRSLRKQATELTEVITTVRGYYSVNVVGRVMSSPRGTEARHDYAAHPGAIPIPATLSLELSELIGRDGGELGYRFVSDLPFAGRPPHALSPLEQDALTRFRASREPEDRLEQADGGLLERHFTLVTPVVMNDSCIGCHNAHPDSPKRDWQAGDVRGLQVVSVAQPIAPGIASLSWLLAYFALAAAAAAFAIRAQSRLSHSVERLNAELEQKGAFLAGLAEKITKYLSPQVFRSIMSGATDDRVVSQRKKLTLFMSDIVDFTGSAERLQPEETTALLNEYFTEMSAIADQYGATIDKFVGDGIVGFFGDPTSRGVAEDARACMAMAIAMQSRMVALAGIWQARGIEKPFRIRIGINTGYCTVGNIGSETRIDYTAIGAEVNLAARLQGLCPPGGIVIAYETYHLVSDMVSVQPLPELQVKGISWPVRSFAVTGVSVEAAAPQAARQRTRIAVLPSVHPGGGGQAG